MTFKQGQVHLKIPQAWQFRLQFIDPSVANTIVKYCKFDKFDKATAWHFSAAFELALGFSWHGWHPLFAEPRAGAQSAVIIGGRTAFGNAELITNEHANTHAFSAFMIAWLVANFMDHFRIQSEQGNVWKCLTGYWFKLKQFQTIHMISGYFKRVKWFVMICQAFALPDLHTSSRSKQVALLCLTATAATNVSLSRHLEARGTAAGDTARPKKQHNLSTQGRNP